MSVGTGSRPALGSAWTASLKSMWEFGPPAPPLSGGGVADEFGGNRQALSIGQVDGRQIRALGFAGGQDGYCGNRGAAPRYQPMGTADLYVSSKRTAIIGASEPAKIAVT
jgi:hypothetical protein